MTERLKEDLGKTKKQGDDHEGRSFKDEKITKNKQKKQIVHLLIGIYKYIKI